MKPIIGISMGDPSGIGAEIAVKALANNDWINRCTPVVFGDYAAMEDAVRFCNADIALHVITQPSEAINDGRINLIDLKYLEKGGWKYKQVDALCGKAAFGYIKAAAECAMQQQTHAIVTGPINKESINLAGYHYSGHTEILAHLTDTKDYAMLLISETLKVIHATTHVSMRQACDRITTDRIYKVIKLANDALKLLGFEKPRIGVAGFNAHCSENGLFGTEERDAIIPGIALAKEEGIDADGPVPPDTVFVKAQAGQYDVVVAMYHDQGHIPIKLSGFKLDVNTNRYTSMSGVNCTVGLPIIRTSVDHGTAFGKAGEGRANEESLVDAMNTAIMMAKTKFSL